MRYGTPSAPQFDTPLISSQRHLRIFKFQIPSHFVPDLLKVSGIGISAYQMHDVMCMDEIQYVIKPCNPPISPRSSDARTTCLTALTLYVSIMGRQQSSDLTSFKTALQNGLS